MEVGKDSFKKSKPKRSVGRPLELVLRINDTPENIACSLFKLRR